jgi:Holliday junction resolvasome RuvABC endonuclease subunit
MFKKTRVLAFDPGLESLGWSVLDLKPDGKIIIPKSGRLSPNGIAAKVNMKEQVNNYGKRLIALSVLENMVETLCNEYHPEYITAEDAFYNPGTPNAYLALSQTLLMIELVLKNKFLCKLHRIPPKRVKMIFTGSGTSGKTSIQDQILNNENIELKHKHVEDMTTHESDAIAVGCAFITDILPSLSCLESIGEIQNG